MIRPITLAVAAVLAPAAASSNAPQADSFIRNRLHLTRYKAVSVDLNGDGGAEVLVYANGPRQCGSGGCDLYVLTPRARTYALVTRVSVTRLPVRVLPASAKGWRDLGVQVAGGGVTRAYEARLRFDGRSYPSNPTMPPARPLARTAGRIVIG